MYNLISMVIFVKNLNKNAYKTHFYFNNFKQYFNKADEEIFTYTYFPEYLRKTSKTIIKNYCDEGFNLFGIYFFQI